MNILVISSDCNLDKSNSTHENYCQKNIKEYCKINNYSYLFISAKDLHYPNDYIRAIIIKSVMDKYKYTYSHYVWLDSDYFMHDFSKKLEDYINNNDLVTIIGDDMYCSIKKTCNYGILFIKYSNVTVKLFEVLCSVIEKSKKYWIYNKSTNIWVLDFTMKNTNNHSYNNLFIQVLYYFRLKIEYYCSQTIIRRYKI